MDKRRSNKTAIFLASSSESLRVTRALADDLKNFAEVTLWSAGAFNPGKTAAESLAEVADRSDFAVFIFTGEDAMMSRGTSTASSHLNFIFELGYLAGRIGLSRTVLVGAPHSIGLPSDLAGVMYVPLSLRGAEDIRALVAPATAAIRSIVAKTPPRAEEAIDFSSCFISYSWIDKEFAAKLHDDLQSVGVRCWLDFKELKTGDPIPQQLDRAIQEHDKVLLVLSGGSVKSAWVRTEVEHALRLERARQKTVLFPIRLDDAVFKVKEVPQLAQLREKYIIDFSNWQDKHLYQRSFSKLVRDLAINTSLDAGAR